MCDTSARRSRLRDGACAREAHVGRVLGAGAGKPEPSLKTMRALAPVLEVRPEELAALVAGGDWATTGTSSYASAPDMMMVSGGPEPSYNKDKVLLSLERRLLDVPPLERIALLNELIAAAVDELSSKR